MAETEKTVPVGGLVIAEGEIEINVTVGRPSRSRSATPATGRSRSARTITSSRSTVPWSSTGRWPLACV